MFANYGSQQVQLLKAAGLNVGYVVPKEGALAWLDCWAITRHAPDAAMRRTCQLTSSCFLPTARGIF